MLKVNELFSGIGAQSAALKRLGIDFEVVATADTDKDALVSYAALHCKVPTEYEYPAATYMADYLAERNIGYDFEKNKPYDWHRLISKKTGKASERLKKYYLSCIISKNRGDVRKIEKLEYADFWTYSFPCQDTSVAGKQAGIEKHTRSGLLYEVGRLLNVSAEHGELPKYLMLENVKNLVGKKFKQQFEDWLEFLEQLGYNNYWQVLNAKNYGIPQNRERVFGISIRKDVDTGDFSFPKGFDNGLRLKDFLEDEVDEKFYISQEKTEKLISQLKDNPWLNKNKNYVPSDGLSITPDREEKRQNGRRFKEDGDPMFTLTGQDRHGVLIDDQGRTKKKLTLKRECPTLRAQSHGNEPKVLQIGNIVDTGNWSNPQRGRIYSADGCSPALNTVGGGGLEPKIIEDFYANREPRVYDECPTLRSERNGLKVAAKEATKQGYAIAEEGDSINIQFPNSDTRRGRAGKECAQTLEASCNQATLAKDKPVLVGGIGEKNFGSQYRQGNRVYDSEAIAMCLHSQPVGNAGGNSYLYQTGYRIRKLTPRECWRLMGFTDEEFQKAVDAGVSNSQLYKQAGNSIVVDVLEYIFGNLLK